MEAIRISSPTAGAAFILVELLAEHGATASPDVNGDWEVVVPLNGSRRGTIPVTLSVAQQWLDFCGLASTSVILDGETHLLRRAGQLVSPLH